MPIFTVFSMRGVSAGFLGIRRNLSLAGATEVLRECTVAPEILCGTYFSQKVFIGFYSLYGQRPHQDPIAEQKAAAKRDALVNNLGNLTLITSSLNPALSNSAWNVKRPELLKFAKLNLTQYFHGPEADEWDEAAILKRSEYLLSQLVRIWPGVSGG